VSEAVKREDPKSGDKLAHAVANHQANMAGNGVHARGHNHAEMAGMRAVVDDVEGRRHAVGNPAGVTHADAGVCLDSFRAIEVQRREEVAGKGVMDSGSRRDVDIGGVAASTSMTLR
jgi:hypothetical protein